MFDRYSVSAQQSLFYARFAALKLGDEVIAPRHVLMALLKAPDTVGGRVLATLQQAELERFARTLSPELVATEARSVEMSFSVGTKAILLCANGEAEMAGSTVVDTGHLLLGLMRSQDLVAPGLVTRDPAELEDIRKLVRTLSAQQPEA